MESRTRKTRVVGLPSNRESFLYAAAAVAEAGDVADKDVVRPEGVAVGTSRGWVIQPPAVVCTRSPITPSSLGRAGTTQGQDLALGAVHHKEGRERDHLDGR